MDRNEAKHVSRPKVERPEAEWLETGEAAKGLQVAQAMEEDPESRCRPFLHALLATFLLTGGRRGRRPSASYRRRGRSNRQTA